MTMETTPSETMPVSDDTEHTGPEVPEAEKEAVYDAVRSVVVPAGIAPAHTTVRFFGEELFVERRTDEQVSFTVPDDLDEELGVALRFDMSSHEGDGDTQEGVKIGFLGEDRAPEGEIRLLANRSHIIARLSSYL